MMASLKIWMLHEMWNSSKYNENENNFDYATNSSHA